MLLVDRELLGLILHVCYSIPGLKNMHTKVYTYIQKVYILYTMHDFLFLLIQLHLRHLFLI